MARRKFPVPLAIALISLLLGGCALFPGRGLAPGYEIPQVAGTVAEAPEFHQAADIALKAVPGNWWRLVGGERLAALTDEMLARNLDLAQARARLDQAAARTKSASGARFPTLDASGSVTGQKVGRTDMTDQYALGLNTGWDADIFGGLRSSERAARLREAATALTLRNSEQIQIVQLAKAWTSAITIRRRIDLTKRFADSLATTLALTEARYRAGSTTATATNVQVARQNLASTRADIPDLEAQLARQLHAIDLQLARLPGTTAEQFDEAWEVTIPDETPLSLPVDLLGRRPDVAAAELNYRAALEDVGAARANMLPRLSFTSSHNLNSGSVSNLFDLDSLVSSLVASLTAPIFHGGQLRQQVRLQEAVARELSSSFGNSALGAMVDVENALIFERAFIEREARLRDTVAKAELAENLAERRYRAGLITLLTLLDTQRSLNNSRQSLALARQQRYDARIDLYRALGGDWRQLEETAPAGQELGNE